MTTSRKEFVCRRAATCNMWCQNALAAIECLVVFRSRSMIHWQNKTTIIWIVHLCIGMLTGASVEPAEVLHHWVTDWVTEFLHVQAACYSFRKFAMVECEVQQRSHFNCRDTKPFC